MNKSLCLWLMVIIACGSSDGGKTGKKDVKDVANEISTDLLYPPSEVEEQEEPISIETQDEEVTLVPGGFGWPCTDPSDCEISLCLESQSGKVCTKPCVEECPDGWTCKMLLLGGSDPINVCVPLFLTLCDPCYDSKDCNTETTGGGAICIDYGDKGRFCGGDCSKAKCPKNYECKEITDAAGQVSRQCVPLQGAECECSARAKTLELSTQCFIENGFGKCVGQRKCLSSGLTQCDAKIPSKEDCNQIDDDCNGVIDDLPDEIECKITNQFGTCIGKGKCIGGVVDCKGQTPQPEQCNGIDDDCNGLTDDSLCYDGNPCTKDLCDIGSGTCVFEPIAGPCDDGNVCTINDHCEDGKCMPGSMKNCDDGNVCTDDFCDTGTGECKHINNNAPCEDGNKCTLNDKCVNGICQSGQYKDCKDDNPCTDKEACDEKTGNCIWEPKNGIPCDDGNPCTTGEQCAGGKCVGGKDYCIGKTCEVPPGKTFCLVPTCEITFGIPLCPCICF